MSKYDPFYLHLVNSDLETVQLTIEEMISLIVDFRLPQANTGHGGRMKPRGAMCRQGRG